LAGNDRAVDSRVALPLTVSAQLGVPLAQALSAAKRPGRLFGGRREEIKVT
jgi:hypothetical protein